MKSIGLLGSKAVATSIFVFLIFWPLTSQAATFTIAQSQGTIVNAANLYGQTFLIPNGKSGTISSFTNLGLQMYSNNNFTVIWGKVWDSPNKISLIADSTNTVYSGIYNSGYGPIESFHLDFPPIAVTAGSSYYLEIGRSSGTGTFYIMESNANPYSYGTSYHNNAITPSVDLQFTLNIDYTPILVPATTPTLSLSGIPVKGISTNLIASVANAGRVKFVANGKNIPLCANVLAIGSPLTATCLWRPSASGAYSITSKIMPSDSATYSSSTSNNFQIMVGRRTNAR